MGFALLCKGAPALNPAAVAATHRQAFAERWVRSVREEGLDQLIIVKLPRLRVIPSKKAGSTITGSKL